MFSGIGNWIKESVSSGGTGNLTTGGADTGYIAFYQWFGDATTNTPARFFSYVISDGNDWESGIGHMSDTTTLVRDKITAKVASGVLTRFPATGLTVSTSAKVFCDLHGDSRAAGFARLNFPFERGTYLNSTANISANYTFAWPVEMRWPGVYSSIADHCATAAGTKYRWAIAIPDSTGVPGNILCQTGDITPATGDNTHALGASTYLGAGLYYLLWSGDGTMAFYGGLYSSSGWSLCSFGSFINGKAVGRVGSLTNPFGATAPAMTNWDTFASGQTPWVEMVL